ncbi:Imm32 family immunity protein [Kitasatospora arboriphila]|uniref:Uncharacterized protein n=1 Tax=Kitasatospora arboriphila TaxID=258052 RepID=A0ABP4EJI9_9ACTN
MRLTRDPVCDEVDLTASAEELSGLAGAVAEGLLAAAPSPDTDALAGVEARRTAGPGVLVHLDPARRLLVISGDAAGREVLADDLRGMAAAEDGGHLHIEHVPGHFYLAEGSLPLTVNSPHGGMPIR